MSELWVVNYALEYSLDNVRDMGLEDLAQPNLVPAVFESRAVAMHQAYRDLIEQAQEMYEADGPNPSEDMNPATWSVTDNEDHTCRYLHDKSGHLVGVIQAMTIGRRG